MPKLDKLVVVTEGSDPKPLAWLKEQVNVAEIALTDPKFDEWLARADGLAIRTYTRVTDAFLDKCPTVKVIGRGGIGIDNIDVAACRRRGVEVVFTPGANTIAVGDFVFGYMLQLLRPWNFFKERAYEPKEFKKIRETVRGVQLNELTLGILGMGRVGKRVGHIGANGFGMRVIYNDVLDIPKQSLDFPAEPVDKETLYRQADVLSIHVDMRKGNENLVGPAELALLKPTAILINTSRGEVLDARALAEAIKAGKIAGAAIDVFAPEPPPADFPLLGMDRVLLTPHLAARTGTALQNMSWVVRDIVAVLEGHKPENPAPIREGSGG